MMRLFLFTIGGQILIVRAATVEEASSILRTEFPDSDLTDAELRKYEEIILDGPPGVIFDLTR